MEPMADTTPRLELLMPDGGRVSDPVHRFD
jgi:hypothetical protein